MGKWLLSLVLSILGWFVGQSKPKVSDGAGAGKLEETLKEKLEKDGWK